MADDFDVRIDRLLDKIDNRRAAEDAGKQQIASAKADFLRQFALLKARAILPAFQYFEKKESQAVRFKTDEEARSVRLVVTIGEMEHHVTYSADYNRQQVEVEGVPNYQSVGLTQQLRQRPLYLAMEEISEEGVKQDVERALEELARQR